jgi:HrpA-like RNA helicase
LYQKLRQPPPLPRITYPASLPIVDRKEDIIRAIRRHSVVVITGETGSGKTTQIPKMCLEAGRGIRGVIGCTQPRPKNSGKKWAGPSDTRSVLKTAPAPAR